MVLLSDLLSLSSPKKDANDKIKALKKNSELTEDDVKQFDKDIQKLTDKYVESVDSAVSVKEKEILSI